MRRLALPLVVLGLLALVALAGAAAPPLKARLAPLLKRATDAAARGDAAATVQALEAALDGALLDAPLEVRKLVVVREPPQGLGLYAPAPKDAVEGGLLRLYVEVSGFGFEQAGDVERVRLSVTGDFSVDDVDDKGVPVKNALGPRPLGVQTLETRTHLRTTSFGLEVSLGAKAPPGTYYVLVQVKDDVTGKSAQREARFVLQR